MARRSPKDTGTPLNAKQQELAQRESQLRDQMQKLERMIHDAPLAAQERTRQQREEIISRATEGGRRLDVSTIALQDRRYRDGGAYNRPRRALRKERREGRIVFLVLVVVLAAAVLWLMTHLNF